MPQFTHLNNEGWGQLLLLPSFEDLEKHFGPLLPSLPASFPRSQFSVDLQTTAPRGLVFHAGSQASFMALYLSKGRLVFTLGAEGKKLKLRSKEKYDDGQWHTVRLHTAPGVPLNAGWALLSASVPLPAEESPSPWAPPSVRPLSRPRPLSESRLRR